MDINPFIFIPGFIALGSMVGWAFVNAIVIERRARP